MFSRVAVQGFHFFGLSRTIACSRRGGESLLLKILFLRLLCVLFMTHNDIQQERRRESSGLRVKGFFVRGFFSFEGVAV